VAGHVPYSYFSLQHAHITSKKKKERKKLDKASYFMVKVAWVVCSI